MKDLFFKLFPQLGVIIDKLLERLQQVSIPFEYSMMSKVIIHP